MNRNINKTKAFWLEYTGEEIADERAAIILDNTNRFVFQVLRMQRLIEREEACSTEQVME